MDAPEPQETGRPADPNEPKAATGSLPGPPGAVAPGPSAPTFMRTSEGAPAPGHSPTSTVHPGASGIAEAPGPAILILSGPEDFIHELTESGLMEPAKASVYRRRFSGTGGLHALTAETDGAVRLWRLPAPSPEPAAGIPTVPR